MKEKENLEQSSVKSRLREFLNYKNIAQSDFEKQCGLSNGYVNNIRKSIKHETFDEKIAPVFPELNKTWLFFGEDDMITKNLSNAHPKEYATHIPVKVVTTKARAGFSDSFYAEEYLKDMPTVLVESDKDYKGKYLAFEVDGDSMEPDYYAGDIVICRELERDKWQYKLHYEQYDFVIAHGTKGIMLKQITDHNLAMKEITCHSLNQEGGKNKDFKLKLGEIAFLYNVVEYRQSGKNKRRNR